ncbi:hypothetical protein P4493_11705 [Bacillus thuringiensis]|nr:MULTISPECIES: hypothetical protein [Bacillus]EEM99181.1 hypothetical protein bthur0014_61980 [Bacillus thuringiensis IBL 4222]MCR6817798.1 hypothetical protein [Bacillus thuringiensis]MED3026980.1 hypothetical protein [Bacillus thuringiensis]MED3234980.1 hypothetical protein [Bacillus thuringiensis]MED3278557.1 hypothetical protein [Bacillus thuringiensis]
MPENEPTVSTEFTGANSITAGNLFLREYTTPLYIHAASAVYSVFLITNI